MGGKNTYARWTRQFQCPVTILDSLRNGFDDFRRVREVLGVGCGRLVDEHGLDWWEIMSILLHGELETLILLQRFVRQLRPAMKCMFRAPVFMRVFCSACGPGV
jgi:hypothetical protein